LNRCLFGRVIAALALVAVTLPLVVSAAPRRATAAPVAPFSPVFHTQDNGSIAIFANTVETCPASATGCLDARKGVATGGNSNTLNNNNYTMGFVNVDPGTGRDNSSFVDVTLPAGSTILFAGLYWAGRQFAGTAGADATHPLNTMLLKGPGQSSYQTITASTTVQIPKATDATGPYQSFKDVTSIVAAAGTGTWFGANVAAATGQDRYGGWSLVVAYRNPTLPLRDLTVFNGFDSIGGTNTDTVPISGFLAPLSGPVRTTLGVIAYEGDLGITGDTMKLASTTLTDALHPANNFFDSTIGTLGVNNTARNPNDLNNLGFDASLVDASNIIPNGATSTSATFSTSGDQYYPGVLTTAIDLFAPAFPPTPKSVVNLNGHNPAQIGDKFEYTIDETNTGLDPAVNSQIQDPIPINTTYVPGSLAIVKGANAGSKTDATDNDQAEFNSSTNTVVFRVGTGATAGNIPSPQGGTLNPGDQTVVRFDVTINPAGAGTMINNTANLLYTAKTLNKPFTQATNTVSTPVANAADMSITKTAGDPTPPAGGTETYTLKVNNAGPSPAESVAVTDSLPAGTTFVSAVPSVGTCTPGASTVSCGLGTLAVSGTATIAVTVRLASGLSPGPLTDLAQVTSTTPDPNLANNTDSATVQVGASADVGITKTLLTNPIVPGSSVTYRLTATNNGPSDAANVVVSDKPDNNLTVTATTPSTGSCNINGGAPLCSIGTLAAGTSATVTLTALVSPSVTGSVTNTGLVSTTTPDPNPANDQANVVSPVSPQADLKVTKSVSPNPLQPGRPAVYTLVVTNQGPSDSSGVVLTDAPPAGETLTSFATTQGDCSINPLSCQLGTIPAGATVQVNVTASIDPSATGNLTNTATVSSATPDPNTANNTATLIAPTSPSADLDIDKTGTNPIIPGGAVAYTLTVTNHGPATARQLTISDPLPADLSGATATSTGGPCPPVTTGEVTCTAALLAVGAADIVTIHATLSSGHSGPLANTATVVSAVTPDPDPTNNSATFTSGTGAQADLSMTKTADSNTVTAGNNTTYTLTATNNGPSDAANVTITDKLPAGVTLVSAPGCTLTASNLTCSLGTLANGSNATVLVTVTVNPDVAAATLTDTATIASTTPDPSLDNNSATLVQNVTQSADLSVIKTGPPTAVAGGTGTYTLTVHNAGPSDAQSATVSDNIPPGITVISVTGPTGPCSRANGISNCPLGTIPAGATVTVTAVVAFDPGLSGSVTDTAEVGSLTPDPNPANDKSPLTTPVTTSADVSITKVALPTTFTAGGTATYTLTVHNAGPSHAQAVTVTDPIPAGVTIIDVSSPGGPCSRANGVGTCDLGTIPAGATYTITANVMIDPAATGPITNTASVTSPTSDPDLTNNAATAVTPVVASADVSILKTAKPEPVPAGGAITWTLVVINAGPSTAADVTVNDPLPPGTTFVSVSAGCTGGTSVNCPIGTMAPGDSVTIVITATTASSLASGTTIANTSTVTSSTPDPNPANNSATAISTLTTSADVGVTKVAESAQATAGGPLIYDIRVTNDGPSDAQTVSLADPVPPGTTVISAVPQPPTSCTPTATTLDCTIGTLPAGQATNIQVTVLLNPSLADRDTLTNTASVASATPDPDPANNTSTATVIVVRSNDLALTKTANPDPAVAGAPLTYTLTVTNNGPSDSNESTIVDPLPAGSTYITSGPSGACTLGTDNVTVTCTVGPVPAGAQQAVTITVLPESDTAPGSTLINTASVTGVDEDPNPANNTATAATPVSASADLSITKSGPAAVVAGTQATYTLTVTNNGPSDATDVTISDPLPVGATVVSATPSHGTCAGTPTLSCTITSLANGADATITVVVDVSPSFLPGDITNTATVSSATPDPNPTNNSAATTATVSGSADVALAKHGPALVVAGNTVTWTVTTTNHGPSDARGVTITDPLPAGVTFVSATGPCTEAGGTVTCSFAAPLTVGANQSIQITGTASPNLAGPTVTNTASVTSSTPDPNPANNHAAATSLVDDEADLAIVKTVTPDPPVPGDPVTFTLTVTNNGPSTAQDVLVIDPISAAVTGAHATTSTGTCVVQLSILHCPLGSLQPAATPVTITVTGTLVASFTGALGNTATVASATPDPDLANNTATLVVPPDAEADLSIAKSASPISVDAGGAVTYTLTVTNNGPSDAQNVVTSDVLDPELSFHSAGAGCAFVAATQTVQCQQATLAAGHTRTFTFTADINPDAQAGPLVNQAAVAAATSDPVLTNNSAAATVTVVQDSDLAVAKTVNKAAAKIGDPLTYTVTVTNHGPSLATGVHLTEKLPAAVSLVSATPNAGTYDTATNIWTVGTLASGGQATLTLTAQILTAAAGTTLVNQASVAGDQPDPDAANNTASAQTAVDPSADLALHKSAPPTVAAGATLTYTLTVMNNGPSTATGVRLTDPLPPGVTLVSSTVSPAGSCVSGPPVNCEVGSLGDGGTATVSLDVTVNPSLASSTTLTNTAAVTSTTDDPDPTNNSASATTSITVLADVSLKKEAPPTAVAGNRLSYTLTASNAGPSEAHGVVVTDPLPAGESTLSASPSQGSCNGDTVVSCQLGTIDSGGHATIILVVQIAPGTGGTTITNTATEQADTPDPDTSNNTGSAETSVFEAATLALSKHGPTSVIAGQTITWTITADNQGPSDAHNVVLEDPLPAGVIFKSASSPCTHSASSITCSFATLAVGSSEVITITGTVSPGFTGNTVANTASATSSSDPDKHTASAVTPVDRQADLHAAKSVDHQSAQVGKTLTYTVTVTNHGPSDASGVTATDLLPGGLQLTGATTPNGTYNRETGLWTIGNLSATGQAALTVTAVVQPGAAGTTITNLVQITHSNQADPDITNRAAAASTTIAEETTSSTTSTTEASESAAATPSTTPSSSTPPAASPAHNGSLPFTGTDAASLIESALILILAGSLLTLGVVTFRRHGARATKKPGVP
jgi:uncharacterized repeat protein (TIGR01451 family)